MVVCHHFLGCIVLNCTNNDIAVTDGGSELTVKLKEENTVEMQGVRAWAISRAPMVCQQILALLFVESSLSSIFLDTFSNDMCSKYARSIE